MKRKILPIILFVISISLISCGTNANKGNNEENNNSSSVKSKNEIEEIFKEAVKNKKTVYDLLSNDKVFNNVEHYFGSLSDRFKGKYCDALLKVSKEAHTNIPIEYLEDEGIYRGYAYTENANIEGDIINSVLITYDPNPEYEVIVRPQLYMEGSLVNNRGFFETGKWEIEYHKNEFDENDKDAPYIENSLSNKDTQLIIYIDKYRMGIATYEKFRSFGEYCYSKILFRNNETKEIILNIPIEISETMRIYGNNNDMMDISEPQLMIHIINIFDGRYGKDISMSFVGNNGFKTQVFSINMEQLGNARGAFRNHVLKEKAF